ncbi:MAG: hypothetical protein MJA83_18375, partial [Gammaproteobacteria bacterium]|nr:hypothetical protein [Gammaproteobacteria bacterium]
AVSGFYFEAVGPVAILAASGAEQVSAVSNDGTFRLLLPGNNGETWTILISEQTVPDRDVTANLRFIQDTVAPVLTVEDTLPELTDAELVEIAGTVFDALTGISDVFVVSSRFGAQRFGMVLDEDNVFFGEVPLDIGDNELTVVAVDGAGNEANVSVSVKRNVPFSPKLLITSPADGDVVSVDSSSVQGKVYTGLEANQVQLFLNGQLVFPQATDPLDGYPFTFDDVRLNEGFNLLQVTAQTPAGPADDSIVITLQSTPPDPEEIPPPDVEITSPTVNTTVSDTAITITGNVASSGGDVTVTVNGEEVEIIGADATGGNFDFTLDLIDCNAAQVEVVVVATDAAGNTTTETFIITCDKDAPVLVLENPSVLDPPSVTRIPDNPIALRGKVTDANLGGVSVNGQTISVTPDAEEDTYTFLADLSLPVQQDTSITVEAWDAAGNTSSREFILNVDTPLSIEFISPRDGTELQVQGTDAEVEVVGRIVGDNAGFELTASADGGQPVAMSFDGDVVTASLTVAAVEGLHEFVIEARDASAALVSRTKSTVDFINIDNIPLEIVQREPANRERGVELSEFIELHFNKPIDPTKLSVEVRETIHGLTYDLTQTNEVEGLGSNRIPPLVEVHRDQEVIDGSLVTFPGNRMVAYYPERDYAYDADIFVDVIYDGQELDRFTYKIRPLPTFVQGIIMDQLLNPVSDITVAIPELELRVTSDENGSFAFGFGLPADENIPGGRHRVVFNPNLQSPVYGTLEFFVNVEEGRLNRAGTTMLPILNPDVPFQQIESGQAEVVLAENELRLDLSEAELNFPDGRREGNVHVQFTPLENIPYAILQIGLPHWIFAVQPVGVEASGGVGVEIDMPTLNGSHAYIPSDGTLVLLLGLDKEAQQIIPVGVGRIEQRSVKSLAPVEFEVLDVIGYAFIAEDNQFILQKFENGEISFQQVITELEAQP